MPAIRTTVSVTLIISFIFFILSYLKSSEVYANYAEKIKVGVSRKLAAECDWFLYTRGRGLAKVNAYFPALNSCWRQFILASE